MLHEDYIRSRGVVEEVLPNTKYRVLLDNGQEIVATISGKIRISSIKIINKDKVLVDVSVYDPSKGRIVWRYI